MNKLNIKQLLIAVFAFFAISINAQDGTVNIDQPKAIEALLEFKKDVKTVDLYKIQIYQSNDSYKANSAKANFMSIYGEWPVSLEFNTPNYKVWVGNFRDRLEADRALLRIKKNYMNAFIFQPKK